MGQGRSYVDTLSALLRVLIGSGSTEAQIKSVTGPILEARDAGDTAYIIVRGLDPVGDDDLVTKRFGDANYTGGGGTLDHAALTSNLGWSTSGHTGTASTFAAFDGGGATTNLTGTQATALLDPFTSLLQGVAPASGGGTANFLRADGTWAAPPSGGGQTDTVVGSAGISNVGNNVDADLALVDDGVTNAKLANMAANTVKANATAALADPADLSVGTNTVVGRVAGNIVAAQLVTGQIADEAVTFAKMQHVTTDRLLGRDTAATGDVEELTVSGGVEFTGSGGIQTSAFTGDVTKTAGGTAQTIANDAVTNAKLANMAANTVKTRSVGSAGDPGDLAVAEQTLVGRITSGVVAALTGTQATTILDTFTSALKGLAPASGGGTTNFLRADGTWAAPAGGSGGADLWNALDANNATFPATNPAGATSRNGHPLLAYDDTTDENVIFSLGMSNDYSAGNIMVDIDWVAATATTGDVKWDVAFDRIAPGGQDIDSDGFAAIQSGTSTTSGTSGVITRTSITLTQAQADSIAAGDAFRLRVTRDTSVGSNMVGDAQILRIFGRQ